ncbi:MAG: hypothetical protein QXP46_07280 [Archaeoglobaceae archaeon]
MVSSEFVELALSDFPLTSDKNLIEIARFLRKNNLKIIRKNRQKIIAENSNYLVTIEIQKDVFAVKKITPKR